MTKRTKTTAAALAIASAIGALAVASCSNGLSTQDAYRACTNLDKSTPTSHSFEDCVACFEDCDDCSPHGTIPETYGCPSDSEGATSTTGSTSTGK